MGRQGFEWRDGERIIRFGPGALADAPRLLGQGYTLLTTERAAEATPALVEAAARLVPVRAGRVDEIAAELLDVPADGMLVALGGGRVIDVAKAIAAARPPLRVGAVPTTLSAAEMTRVHRRAAGASGAAPGVRPAVVINDPALCASQPDAELAASAANALAHAIEGPLTTQASPVPALAAAEAVRLIASAWSGGQPDRPALALAALLSGYTIDATGYGLHHVAAQTLVRVSGAWHGLVNAALLPHTTAALRMRAGDAVPAGAEALAVDLARRSNASSLSDLGVTAAHREEAAGAAAGRPDLALTPPPADVAELRAIYAAAA